VLRSFECESLTPSRRLFRWETEQGISAAPHLTLQANSSSRRFSIWSHQQELSFTGAVIGVIRYYAYSVLVQTILQQTSCSLLQFLVMDGAPVIRHHRSSLILSSTAMLHDFPFSEALMIKDYLNQT
jgi:hypothetical protein